METKFVTAEDKVEYADFFRHHLIHILGSRKRAPLYHYTSGATLIRILESSQMWSTQVACMNDSKEWIHAIETFKKGLDEYRRGTFNPAFEPCLKRLEQACENPEASAVGVFLTCFSEKRDDLSQWRAYGGPTGYSLCFSVERLINIVSGFGGINLLSPVLYGWEGGARTLIEDAIKWAEHHFLRGIDRKRAPTVEEWAEDFSRYWLWSLSFYAPFLKHESFRDEAEWRVVHTLMDEDKPNLTFQQRTSMMTRHLPLPLNEKKEGSAISLLPLERITVGPSNFGPLSRIGVGDLLVKHGYGESVPVDNSAIPYRPYL
jgi:hypothetical protein